MESNAFILILDFGTSNVRAGLISTDTGDMVQSQSVGYQWLSPVQGQVELDPDEIWESSEKAVATLLKSYDRTKHIIGISFSFFGDNIIPVDSNGNKLYNLLPAFDSRSKKETKIIDETIGEDLFYQITGGSITPMLVASKILWLKNNYPDIFKNVKYYFSIQQYIINKLGFEPANDFSMAARKMLYDNRRDWWSKELVDMLGIEDSTLGQIVPSGTIIGRTKYYGNVELPEEIPVLVGGHDTGLGIMGLGATSPKNGYLADVMGTFNCIGCYSDRFLAKNSVLKEVQLYRGPSVSDSKSYVVIGAIPTGGALLEWFVNKIYPEREPNKDKFVAVFEKIDFDGKGNLFTVPAFDLAQGLMYGFDLSTDRLAIFKSIVEGVTYKIKDITVELDKLFNTEFNTIYCGGGGSKSSKWLQLISDTTARKVKKVGNLEASALGAAIIAATSVGFYKDVEEAVQKMVTIKEVHNPNEETERIYEDQYNRYKRIENSLQLI